jgi:DNA-binding NarL/FixJ family response regulator
VSLTLLDRPDQTASGSRFDGEEEAGRGAGAPLPELAASPSRPAQGMSMTLRVLVVDDSASIRTELRALLEDAGCVVVGEGGHGAEGVMLARELQPNVVVMDVRMPILDGIAATAYLARELPDTRVILFSAFDDPGLADAARTAGASCFLIKGVSPAAIVAAVQDAAGA